MDSKEVEEPRWAPPSREELEAEFDSYKSFDNEYHIARLEKWYTVFGPKSDLLFIGGIPAAIALHELEISYVMGLNLSTIMSAHVFIEQVLGAGLIVSGKEKVAEKGLASIINYLRSEEDGYSSTTLNSIDELRKIRIAYFHAHEGLKERSFMGRWIESEVSDPYLFADQDSHKAIVAVANLIHDRR